MLYQHPAHSMVEPQTHLGACKGVTRLLSPSGAPHIAAQAVRCQARGDISSCWGRPVHISMCVSAGDLSRTCVRGHAQD